MENNSSPSKSPDKKAVGLIALGVILFGLTVYSAIPVTELNIAIKLILAICATKIYKSREHRIIAVLASVLLPVGFLAMAVLIAIGGILISKGAKGKLVFVSCAVASAVALTLASGTPEILISLINLIPAIVLGICILKKADRMTSICSISASLTVIIAIPILVWAGKQGFLVSAEDFSNGIRGAFNEMLASYADSFVKIAEESQMVIDQTAIAELTSLSGELVGAVLSISPALIIVFSNILSFLANLISNDMRLSGGETLEREEMDFSPSTPSAWIL